MRDPRSDEFRFPEGNEDSICDGEYVKCPHCDGTGEQQGPGGKEACCHCHGKGERWFDRYEDADMDVDQ